MSKLSQYQAFVTVVEQGSITQASASLNLSVPAVSKQLSMLESRLEAQLFFRTHKKLEVTEAGLRFYARCKDILRSIEQAEEVLKSEQGALAGKLTVSMSKSLCRSVVMEALTEFAKAHPKIRLDIQLSDVVVDLYTEDIDFAFRLGNVSDSPQMITSSLLNTQLIACAAPEYAKRLQAIKSLTDLKEYKFILPSSLNPHGMLKAFLSEHSFDFNNGVAHTTNDIEAVYQLTRAGLGIGLMLDVSIRDELKKGILVPVIAELKWPTKPLYLLSKKKEWETKKHQAFRFFIEAYCNNSQFKIEYSN